MAFFGLIPDSVLATLEEDGKQILKWAVSEAQALVAIVKNDKGFVGFVTGIIDELDGAAGEGKTGAEKFEDLVHQAVPELVKLLTSGQDAFAVVETEIFDLMREVGQSIYNSVRGTAAGAILNGMGIPVPPLDTAPVAQTEDTTAPAKAAK